MLKLNSNTRVETMVVHSLASAGATLSSTISSKKKSLPTSGSRVTFAPPHHDSPLDRRSVVVGLVVAISALSVDRQNAIAAKRPPPPPPMDKKDPNVSGVQAKVQASKKRKEAMKQAMAKQRERGQTIINQPPPSE